MSYAGTYGADETCRHDTYWRSCQFCSQIGPNATQAQYEELQKRRKAEWEQKQAARKAAEEAKKAEAKARTFPVKLGDQPVEKTITYRVEINDFTHYDCWNYQNKTWGGHPSYQYSQPLQASTESEAKLEALELQVELEKRKACTQHKLGVRVTSITKVVKERTADGWKRTTELEISVPQPKRCACGKLFWPVKGEKACHKMEKLA